MGQIDEALRRSDQVLTELIETVETARALPMSSSCVLPRERTLDLLDELRDVLPPEITDARRLVARRDEILDVARGQADRLRDSAAADAQRTVADADTAVTGSLAAAQETADRIVADGRAEQARLVSATAVHEQADAVAGQLRAEAEDYRERLMSGAQDYDREVRAEADAYALELRAEAEAVARDVRAEAERYATKLTLDAEDYAEHTLDELSGVLNRSAATAEQGRVALARRRATVERPSRADAPPEQPFDVEDGADAERSDDTRRTA